jgi:hypothetical protein
LLSFGFRIIESPDQEDQTVFSIMSSNNAIHCWGNYPISAVDWYSVVAELLW